MSAMSDHSRTPPFTARVPALLAAVGLTLLAGCSDGDTENADAGAAPTPNAPTPSTASASPGHQTVPLEGSSLTGQGPGAVRLAWHDRTLEAYDGTPALEQLVGVVAIDARGCVRVETTDFTSGNTMVLPILPENAGPALTGEGGFTYLDTVFHPGDEITLTGWLHSEAVWDTGPGVHIPPSCGTDMVFEAFPPPEDDYGGEPSAGEVGDQTLPSAPPLSAGASSVAVRLAWTEPRDVDDEPHPPDELTGIIHINDDGCVRVEPDNAPLDEPRVMPLFPRDQTSATTMDAGITFRGEQYLPGDEIALEGWSYGLALYDAIEYHIPDRCQTRTIFSVHDETIGD